MHNMWIAENADSKEKLVLSRENALALPKIWQIQETGIFKTSLFNVHVIHLLHPSSSNRQHSDIDDRLEHMREDY